MIMPNLWLRLMPWLERYTMIHFHSQKNPMHPTPIIFLRFGPESDHYTRSKPYITSVFRLGRVGTWTTLVVKGVTRRRFGASTHARWHDFKEARLGDKRQARFKYNPVDFLHFSDLWLLQPSRFFSLFSLDLSKVNCRHSHLIDLQ